MLFNRSRGYKNIILLAYPVCLSQLGTVLVSIADSAMVGQIGTVELAASSLANSVFFIFITFVTGITFGITPLIAAADGTKNLTEISRIFKHGILISAIVGLGFSLLLWKAAPSLRFLNQPEAVVELAIPYFRTLAISLIPYSIFQGYRQFMEGLSLTKPAMYISLFSNLINIGLNYLLIYGNFGFPQLGLNGAGLATLISRTFMPFAIGILVLLIPQSFCYLKKMMRLRISIFQAAKILNIGIPCGIQFLFENGALSFAAIMMGWLGTQELAAHQIALSLVTVTYMIATGISAAATIGVGNQFGRRNFRRLRETGFSSLSLTTSLSVVSAFIFIFGNHYLSNLFVRDSQVIQIASSLLVLAAFFQIFDSIQVVIIGALRGMGDVAYPTPIAIGSYWILGLPLAYTFSQLLHLGASGIWYGLSIGFSVAGGLLFLRFDRLSKQGLR
ncbi:MATE family efflux transporter [Oscillatoriales cyanobacterium LEGE 11467]|uniref:Probable multidrug resistance protein NorM n=1 Tax=Zarconia navalis LEGE 11467 TaxID=1828826 RepID=A0A928Z817_9CYAN|nr:MATE family efflux transporter [Zarconia navalis]MBE9040074.1 MATE family efflux transporter [Zarconia navalis LEGE 11467]